MKDCILVLDNLRSVENTGSIFRTAEGLGVKRIVLVGTTPAPTDRFGRRRKDFAKVALGAEELISWEVCKSISPKLKELRKAGYKIAVLEQHPKAKELMKLKASKLALVVGNEVEGVSRAALRSADFILEIPMRGKKESLNVSVAAGIALFELLK